MTYTYLIAANALILLDLIKSAAEILFWVLHNPKQHNIISNPSHVISTIVPVVSLN